MSKKQLPSLIVVSGPSPTAQAVMEATTVGSATLFSAFSQAVDLLPRDKTDLLDFLNVRLALVGRAKERAGGFLGRIYNKYSGEDADYVELSGVQLRQTLSAAGIKVPEFITADGQYKLREDLVRQAVSNLE